MTSINADTRWGVVWVFSVMYLTVSLAAVGVVGCVSTIADDLSISLPVASSLVVSYALGFAVGGPLLDRWIAGCSIQRSLFLAVAAFVAVALVWASTYSIVTSAAVRFALGMVSGFVACRVIPLAVTASAPAHIGRVIAAVNLGMVWASIVGVPLVAAAAESFGWRAFPIILSLLGFASLCLLAILLGRKPLYVVDERRSEVGALHIAYPNVYIITGLQSAGQYALFAFVYAYASEELGLTADVAKVGLMLFGVGAASGAVTSGYLLDRGRAWPIVRWGLSFNWLSLGLLYIIPHDTSGALTAFAVIGFTSLLVPPAVQKILATGPVQDRSRSLAWNSSSAYLGIAIGTFFGGRVLAMTEYSMLPLTGMGLILLAFAASLKRPVSVL